MLILVVNCNVSELVSRAIDGAARAAAGVGTQIHTLTPTWGVASAEGYLDSQLAAVGMVRAIREYARDNEFDAVVLAGYGEAGREACRELLDVPVVDITDAAAQLALHLAPRFGVVTSLPRTRYQIIDSLHSAGVAANCVGVLAADIPVLHVGAELPGEDSTLALAARELLEQGAEALVLGCAGLAGMGEHLARLVGVPVVDPVAAGVAVAESLVRLGLRTSKVCTYARPLPKHRPGWDSAADTPGSPKGLDVSTIAAPTAAGPQR